MHRLQHPAHFLSGFTNGCNALPGGAIDVPFSLDACNSDNVTMTLFSPTGYESDAPYCGGDRNAMQPQPVVIDFRRPCQPLFKQAVNGEDATVYGAVIDTACTAADGSGLLAVYHGLNCRPDMRASYVPLLIPPSAGQQQLQCSLLPNSLYRYNASFDALSPSSTAITLFNASDAACSTGSTVAVFSNLVGDSDCSAPDTGATAASSSSLLPTVRFARWGYQPPRRQASGAGTRSRSGTLVELTALIFLVFVATANVLL